MSGSCGSILAALRDVSVAAAALTTSIVAVRGLKSWQRQKHWEEDTPIAREIASTVRTLSRRLVLLKSSKNFDLTFGRTDTLKSSQLFFSSQIDQLDASYDDLVNEIASAEVIWKEDTIVPLKAVRDLAFDVLAEAQTLLEVVTRTGDPDAPEVTELRSRLLHDDSTSDKDLAKVQGIFNDAHAALRKKMGRPS